MPSTFTTGSRGPRVCTFVTCTRLEAAESS
jgi:hypothetical protein